MKTLFKNIHTLVTCDDSDSILHDADLLIEDNEITAVGEVTEDNADKVVDASNLFVYPGLVNTHHHLYQYFTRNLPQVQGFELFDWLTALYEIWKNLDTETILFSSLAGMGELMKYGCTTCFDHHYVFPKDSGDLLAAQFEAADLLGIRMHASRGSMDLSKKDGGLPPDSVVQTVDEILKDCEKAVKQFHDPSKFSMRQILFAPCSPFSVSEDLLRESAVLARNLGVRLHTHLCETKDEERFTLEKKGMRPYAYMESIGWTGSDVFYAHGIHFNDEELKALQKTQTGIAHCPCSNMKLSSGTARIPEMLELGIPVGLAVDGSASNDCSNLLHEIRISYLLHRLNSGSKAPTGYDILKMATRGSAKLLGRDDIGQIAPGKAADFFAIRRDRIEMLCAEKDPANLFGTVGYNRPVDLVYVNGKETVRDGELLNVDEEQIRVGGLNAVERLLQGE